MPNKKQTYIDSYFKSVQKGVKVVYKFKKDSINNTMSKISSKQMNTLKYMKQMIHELDLNSSVNLPFPLPHYGSDSEESAIKDKNTNEVSKTNNHSPQKCASIKKASPEISKPRRKRSNIKQSFKKSTKNQGGKEKSLSSKKDKEMTPIDINLQDNTKKTSFSPVKEKVTSFIGVYSPSKTATISNNITLRTESTSTDDMDKTILEGTAEYISTNFMNYKDLQKSPNKVTILNDKTLVGKEVIPIQMLTPTRKSVENNMKNTISNTDTKSKVFVKNETGSNEAEWNTWVLDFATKVIKYVGSHNSLQKLLTGKEVTALSRFLELPKKEYIFFGIKLYTRKQIWYNVFGLTTKVKLQMLDREVMDMYTCLSKQGFVDNDYSSEPIDDLLEQLHVSHIKDICSEFKLPLLKGAKKSTMIDKLKLHCNRQSTLTFTRSIKDILVEKIKDKLGHCVRINSEFYKTLHKVHLLYKFVVGDFQKATDLYLFLTRIREGKIVMPEFTVNENFEIFSSINDFSSFQKSLELKEEVFTAIEKKYTHTIYELCSLAYEELKIIVARNISDDRPACIQRFTPGYQHTKILSIGLKHLTKHYPVEVSKWLHLLLQQKKYCKNLRGSWYNTLIMVQYSHLKQHEMAIHTLIQALQEKDLSKIDFIELNARAERIKRNQTNKVSQLQFGKISGLQPILMENFPDIEIDAKAIRSDVSGRKRDYYEKSEAGLEIMSVEKVALSHYYHSFANGLHCEGSLFESIFFVLFWDIIYGDKVPFAFISEIQHYPLDLMSKEFYTNREEDICKRLSEIEDDWSLAKLNDFVCDVWTEHSSKKSFINTDIVDKPEQLCDILLCIGREKLRKIMEHLVKDFKSYHSGLPDLFLWNIKEKKCKFVEVKGEGDKLSSTQKCWLDFLRSIEMDIEVCHVHSIGSKRKLRRIKSENSDKVKSPKKQKTKQ